MHIFYDCWDKSILIARENPDVDQVAIMLDKVRWKWLPATISTFLTVFIWIYVKSTNSNSHVFPGVHPGVTSPDQPGLGRGGGGRRAPESRCSDEWHHTCRPAALLWVLQQFAFCFQQSTFSAINIAEAKKKLDKPLLRRKSELPTDVLTQKSLETYKVLYKYKYIH